MSKNTKNAKRMIAAREMSAKRVAGGKGPAKTQPVHGKRNAWFQKFDTYREFLASKAKKPRRQDAVAVASAA
jgi:hypothetical protein